MTAQSGEKSTLKGCHGTSAENSSLHAFTSCSGTALGSFFALSSIVDLLKGAHTMNGKGAAVPRIDFAVDSRLICMCVNLST